MNYHATLPAPFVSLDVPTEKKCYTPKERPKKIDHTSLIHFVLYCSQAQIPGSQACGSSFIFAVSSGPYLGFTNDSILRTCENQEMDCRRIKLGAVSNGGRSPQ